MIIRIPILAIPKFRRLGIDLSDGIYSSDGKTFLFNLHEDDEEVFLDVMRSEITNNPKDIAEALEQWIHQEDSRIGWKKRLIDMQDPFGD